MPTTETDMFGYVVHDKKPKSEAKSTRCRFPVPAGGKCGKSLTTEAEKYRGLCESHIVCDDAKKAKSIYVH